MWNWYDNVHKTVRAVEMVIFAISMGQAGVEGAERRLKKIDSVGVKVYEGDEECIVRI